MEHRTIQGRILYTSKKPERFDQKRGHEAFTFTHHTDGKVTLRAHCEIEEPSPTVLRDVIYSLDEHGKPMDCHVRLTVGDRFMGSGWFVMSKDHIDCESYGPEIGRVSQRVETKGDYDGFGTHPIVADAFLTKCMDLSLGPHKREIRTFLPSGDHRGATPPLITQGCIFLEYMGDEERKRSGGNFHCHHYRFSDEKGGMITKDGAHPLYDLWVTADRDSLFVKGGVGGYMQTWYELVELVR